MEGTMYILFIDLFIVKFSKKASGGLFGAVIAFRYLYALYGYLAAWPLATFLTMVR